MAYTDPQPHSHARLAGATGVALVHVALAFGLVTGLAIKGFAPEKEKIIDTFFVPDDVPPPDDPTPPDQKQADPIEPAYTPPAAPMPPLELPRPARIPVTVELPPITETLRIPAPIIDPTPPAPPAPAYDAHGPLPLNGPAGWITNAEYPLRALQRGLEGTVRYELQVGTDGKVDDCRILSSTGQRVLDDTTCRWVSRRARFDPAINEQGSKIAGTYTGTAIWQIPED